MRLDAILVWLAIFVICGAWGWWLASMMYAFVVFIVAGLGL